jgi:type I restriction enzyme S subunit
VSWPIGKVSNIADVISGFAFKSEWFGSGSSKVIRIGDLQDGRVDLEGAKTFDEAVHHIRDQFKIKNGDILMALSGATVGKIAVADALTEGAFLNQRVAIIRGRLPENTEYLKYIFSGELLQKLLLNAGGAAQPNLSPKDLVDMEIPLPPLAEQKRIAAILDKADAIRRKRQQAIQLADEFLRAVFLDMFGDPVTNPKGFPVTKLGELCEDLFLGLTSKVDYIDGTDGYPLVRAKDINTGELSFDDVRYISEDQHKKLTKNHLTRKGDLLVSKSGTLGTCAIVRTDREFSTYESIFTVRPDSFRLDLHYLIHLLQNKGFKEKLIGNKVGGTVAHLNLKMFRGFEIGVPPIELQRVFSNTIMKCEAKLEKYRASGEESEFLFNSLSQKAFSGQL